MHFTLSLEAKGKRFGALSAYAEDLGSCPWAPLSGGALADGASYVARGEVSFDLENLSGRNFIFLLLDMLLECYRPGRRAFGSAAIIRGFQRARKVGVSDSGIIFLWLFY
jgi:hypothetical protein